MADEASARAAGDGAETEEDEDAPPKFSGAFYKRTFTLDVSLDGMDGRDLPISIESICGVPRPLASQALQLAGADGVAIVYSTTAVYNEDGSRERGQAASTAVGGADTATLKVRLARSWRENEDGDKVATFKTIRLDVTD